MQTVLTYKSEQRQPSTTVEREIRPSKEWGMFTPQGNQAMRRKAETLVKNVLKVRNSDRSVLKYLHAFDKYFKSYQRYADTSKTGGEANDTAVREQVWCFAEQVGKAVGVSYDALDDIWEQRHRYNTSKKK